MKSTMKILVEKKYEIKAWFPNKEQDEYMSELDKLYKKNEDLAAQDAITLAKKMNVTWNQITDMSNHEGYWLTKGDFPTHLLRQIRNKHKF